MSLRPFALAVLTLSLATACGAESSSGTSPVGWELLVDKAIADQLASFQVVVLPNGKLRDCTELQKTCLKSQVKTSEALVLRDDVKGTEGRALRFPATINGTSVTSQDVGIEVPVGRDYALVIEAISKDSPPRFLGSSCNYLPEVSASLNAPVLAAPMTLAPVDCDPTI